MRIRPKKKREFIYIARYDQEGERKKPGKMRKKNMSDMDGWYSPFKVIHSKSSKLKVFTKTEYRKWIESIYRQQKKKKKIE